MINEKLDTNMFFRTIEAILEMVAKLGGLYLVYYFGSDHMPDQSSKDTLFSILLLPALLILKNGHMIFEPITIRAFLTDNDVTVRSGLLTRTSDTLKIDTLENVELVKTPLGRICSLRGRGYGTLNLYAYGGAVVMPHLKDPEGVRTKIIDMMNAVKKKV